MTKTEKTKPIRVSLENYEKIIEVKGQLEIINKKPQFPNDVITYLFEIKEEKEKNES